MCRHFVDANVRVTVVVIPVEVGGWWKSLPTECDKHLQEPVPSSSATLCDITQIWQILKCSEMRFCPAQISCDKGAELDRDCQLCSSQDDPVDERSEQKKNSQHTLTSYHHLLVYYCTVFFFSFF